MERDVDHMLLSADLGITLRPIASGFENTFLVSDPDGSTAFALVETVDLPVGRTWYVTVGGMSAHASPLLRNVPVDLFKIDIRYLSAPNIVCF
jgi:hypothetical protein